MKALTDPLLELESYQHLLDDIKNKITPVLITGVIDVQQNHLIYGLEEHTKRPSLILTSSELRAKEICEDMQFFYKNVMLYPSKDIIFYSADVHSKDIIKKRFDVMDALLKDKCPTVVMTVEAAFDRLMEKTRFSKWIQSLNVGDVIQIDVLMKKLVYMGYERTELVEGAGQFAARGGILDVFSPTEENPVRLEFWDDEIDSIRIMDAFSQRSIENVQQTRLFPMRELVYEEEDVENAIQKMMSEFKKVKSSYENKGLEEEAETLQKYIGEAIERLSQEKTFSGVENYISYFFDKTVSILDYLHEDTIIYFDEPQRIRKHADNVAFEFGESIMSRIGKGYMLPSQANLIFSYSDLLKEAEKYPQVLLATITQSVTDFKLKDMISFSVKATSAFQQRMDLFCEEIEYLKKENYRILILAGAQTRCERLVSELYERGIEAGYAPNLSETTVKKGMVMVARGKLSHGFEYQMIKFSVFAEKELFGEGVKKQRSHKKKKGTAIESFTDLRVGNYVVHDNHGIGVFQGLEQITVDGVNKDYIKIGYSDGGNLFVPVNQMDMIQKYIGSDAASPKLNKLGGQDWNKAKTRVRAAVAILAEDLVALYAKRQATKGYVYSHDNLWQKEFEETFPYEETEDQLNAIEDVKKDMESTKVMDRLICGDVGYGKTEVAIRAAFKAVQDGKQVAYLVPTTILAQQHYNTFAQRMMDYPIRVDLLSRFRSTKQQKETLQSLSKGYVDILIGTHRLLSKDVEFKNLGMVIVDEEQRFGVTHKEKLKTLKENVDVLTLTATPIPRTLHMSLAGIRDMSILEEPPLERHPIQTYVMESNQEFVKDAIHRELSRGGQVYYLHNRVTNISEVAMKLQKLVPEANVAYAHGQMTERELESIMKDFIEGEINVLVCTTIIETGLDISNVNTIIIQDADHMGLSQLYQLRGRVGRSNKIAYAYLMYKKDKVLQEVAEKRLQTIKEFTEFGSGFKIAMRDLEIRGAGNLLGAEQHGHMETVGYDMYCKLLDEAVRTLKGEVSAEEFETSVDLNINAYIPSYYIANEEQKLEVYKKIAQITNQEDYFDIQEEIEDRYGNLPKCVNMLLEVVLVKAEAHKLGILSISNKNKNILVTFKADASINPESITRLVTAYKGKYLFTVSANPYITIKTNEKEKMDSISYIKNLLHELNSFD